MTIPASDNFDAYADAAQLGAQANWENFGGQFILVSTISGGNRGIFGGSTGNVFQGCRWVEATDNFDDDQNAELKLITISSYTDFGGPAVRCTATGECYCFTDLGSGATYTLYKHTNAGGYTSLDTGGSTPTVNDVLKVSAIGTAIAAFVNGSPEASGTDSTHTTGQPGVFMDWSDSNDMKYDLWAADNESTGATGTGAVTLATISMSGTGSQIMSGTAVLVLGEDA